MTARVQYSHPQINVNTTKVMTPPINIGSPDAWFKAARKAIPQIPNAGWYVHNDINTTKTLLFELINRQTRERCAVIIVRN